MAENVSSAEGEKQWSRAQTQGKNYNSEIRRLSHEHVWIHLFKFKNISDFFWQSNSELADWFDTKNYICQLICMTNMYKVKEF